MVYDKTVARGSDDGRTTNHIRVYANDESPRVRGGSCRIFRIPKRDNRSCLLGKMLHLPAGSHDFVHFILRCDRNCRESPFGVSREVARARRSCPCTAGSLPLERNFLQNRVLRAHGGTARLSVRCTRQRGRTDLSRPPRSFARDLAPASNTRTTR